MNTLINKLGIGTVQFGLDYGISNNQGQTNFIEIKRILKYALDLNIKILDTAKVYGNSEKQIGESEISEEFDIVSKFMPSRIEGELRTQFGDSCKDLRVQMLYGYLAHRPMNLLDNPKDWKALNELKETGKVNKIGFSLNTPNELEKLLDVGYLPDIVQVPFNYFDRRFEPLMIELKSKGCEIHSRSAFLQGLFFTNVEKLSPYFQSVKPEIKKLQEKYKANLSSFLLSYVLSRPFIDFTVIGAENCDQLKMNVMGVSENFEFDNENVNVAEYILTPSKWPNRDE